LGLMEPTGSGIGGDIMAIVWHNNSRTLYGLNGSGRSPKGLSYQTLKGLVDSMNRTDIPPYGCLPISVPGCVDGWFQLHSRWGNLSMLQVLQPAINYARNGFPLTQAIAGGWNGNVNAYVRNLNMIPEFQNFNRTYMPNGRAPRQGEIFKNPDLANTLEMIANGGRDVFYNGTLTDVMDTFFRRAGCYLRKEDFANHSSTWETPLTTNYKGYDVYELYPSTQGLAALQMLNILEFFNISDMEVNSADYLHINVETKKLAFADRAKYYTDPQFASIPVALLLSKEYAFNRSKLIDMHKAMRTTDAGNQILSQGDTIYMTVADKEGNMVSLIQSNFRGMGSGMVPDGLGFIFQDRGQLFALEEGHANIYAPGKRPFHTIIPAFATKDGQPFLSFGVMGGDMQPQGHVQILCNMIDFGMDVQAAGDLARWYHYNDNEPTGEVMLDGGLVSLESGVSEKVRQELRERGHVLQDARGSYGGYQAIMWDNVNRVYHGASEFRKDGHAAGY